MAVAQQLARSTVEHTCLTGAVATGAGTQLEVSEYENVMVMIACDATATATVQIQGTGKNISPDWDSAQSSTNHWDYLEVVDLEDGTAIDGDTGIVFSAAGAATTVRQFEVNTSTLTWINANVTAWTAAGVSVWIRPFKS